MTRADARGYPSLWRAEQAKREPGLRGRTVRLRSRTVPSLGGPSGSPGIWETLWRRPSWVRIPPPALFEEPPTFLWALTYPRHLQWNRLYPRSNLDTHDTRMPSAGILLLYLHSDGQFAFFAKARTQGHPWFKLRRPHQ